MEDDDEALRRAEDAEDIAAAAAARREGGVISHDDLMAELGLGDESYRTCSECGRDCSPEPAAVDGVGIRVAFNCELHGLQTIVDPLELR